MNKKTCTTITALLLLGAISLTAGCQGSLPQSTDTHTVTPTASKTTPKDSANTDSSTNNVNKDNSSSSIDVSAEARDVLAAETSNTVRVASAPTDITVVVNKKIMLPDGYTPADLVEPKVPFIFKEKDDRRLMRKEAAAALEQLFAGAKTDGINLAGVSGYRSYATQKSLFDYYVKVQGEETARKYSAVPGTSEHQTGLAMDVSGIDGKCAAEDCFAKTPEANWLVAHAAEYGFIIRYPKGKESITGYNYEAWHLRYIGTSIAKKIAEKGITLEEYMKNSMSAVK